MGPILSPETDAGVIQKKLEQQIRECLDELSNYDPLSDPAGTNIAIAESEEGDAGAKAPAKANSKSVGRPKKTAKFAK
jgi:hypothetical protein